MPIKGCLQGWKGTRSKTWKQWEPPRSTRTKPKRIPWRVSCWIPLTCTATTRGVQVQLEKNDRSFLWNGQWSAAEQAEESISSSVEKTWWKRPDMINKAWQKKAGLERDGKVGNQCQINNVVDIIGPLSLHSTSMSATAAVTSYCYHTAAIYITDLQ